MNEGKVPLLETRRVTKSFPGVRALKEADFALNAGEIHALVGENGAGKSTFVKIIAGAHSPDDGEVLIDGQEARFHHPREARERGIAIIYQEPSLFPDLTVAENIFLGRQPRRLGGLGIDWKTMMVETERLLAGIGTDLPPLTPVNRLSVANRQMVEIARALGTNARILVMDEPTSSLSDREIERLFDVMRRLRGQGVGIVFISHRLDEIFAITDKVTVMRDGEIVGTFATGEVDRDRLISLMVGREVSQLYPKTPGEFGEPVLELSGLWQSNKFRDINLSVRRGEVLGLFGLVGSGRSEVAQAVFGITRPERGEVRLEGKRLVARSPQEAIQSGVVYLPEDRQSQGLILPLSVAENVSLAILRSLSRASGIDKGKEDSLAREYVTRLSIKTPSVRQQALALSGGNQQKVVLGKWLATQPKVLILDEPTRGVDVGAKAEIHRIIDELAHRGLAIILISSDLPEILGMSDRVAVLREGRLAGIVDRGEATAERVLRLAFGAAKAATA